MQTCEKQAYLSFSLVCRTAYEIEYPTNGIYSNFIRPQFLKCVRNTQVIENNLKMKAHWFTIIKKSARTKQKIENEGVSVSYALIERTRHNASSFLPVIHNILLSPLQRISSAGGHNAGHIAASGCELTDRPHPPPAHSIPPAGATESPE